MVRTEAMDALSDKSCYDSHLLYDLADWNFQYMYCIKIKTTPAQAYNGPWEFQKVEASRFQDSQHMKLVRASALCVGHVYPQEIFLVLISVRLIRSQGLSAAWSIMSKKNSSDTFGNQTRLFPTCSAVSILIVT
jgi:hypothetical protein